MTFMKSLSAATKTFVAVTFVVGVTLVSTAMAAPPGTPYNLGETLQPTCAPGSANCTVVTPAASGANSDITSLSGLTTPLSMPQGGTGLGTIPANRLIYSSALDTFSALGLDPMLSFSGGNLILTDDALTEAKLDVNNAPSDGAFLKWNNATTEFIWGAELDPVWLAAEPNYANLGQAETITADWDNTANPWAANELVSTVMIAGENVSLLANDASYITNAGETDQVWVAAEPNYANLGQAETITGNWDNTANPWAANELVSTVMIAGENVSLLANDAGYLTAETDPVAGAINGIIAADGAGNFSAVTDNSANWNTAFGWGNHAAAGYAMYNNPLDTYVFTIAGSLAGLQSVSAGGASIDIINALGNPILTSHDGGGANPYNGALEVGLLPALGGNPVCYVPSPAGGGAGLMLTDCGGMVETDPIVGAVNGIVLADGAGNISATANNSANWDTAFGWGNHASAGYLTAANNLSDVANAATARTNLGLGSGDSVNFTDVTVSGFVSIGTSATAPVGPQAGSMYLDTTPTPAALCIYDGSAWVDISTNASPGNCA